MTTGMPRLDSLGFRRAKSASPWDSLASSAFTRSDVPPRLR
jgi:hypothetical protein